MISKKPEIVIYPDGSALGNPGPGGYGAVIWFVSENKIIEIGKTSLETKTTNNRMELMAIIESLLSIRNKKGKVIILTDSEYIYLGITKWIYKWLKNDWRTANKKKVLNQDLWQRLLLLVEEREKNDGIEWKKIEAHKGILGNERADKIATAFANKKNIIFVQRTKEEYEKIFKGKLFY